MGIAGVGIAGVGVGIVRVDCSDCAGKSVSVHAASIENATSAAKTTQVDRPAAPARPLIVPI